MRRRSQQVKTDEETYYDLLELIEEVSTELKEWSNVERDPWEWAAPLISIQQLANTLSQLSLELAEVCANRVPNCSFQAK